jgi:hypothetical protein
MVEQLVKAASEFSGAEMFPDDVCLVAVEAASLMKR